MATTVQSALGAALLVSCTICSGAASAASVSYYLNQSNVTGLPDGTNYLKVTLDDNTPSSTPTYDNLITFTVEVLGSLTPDGSNFGIQSFGFNLAGNASLSAGDISGLDSLWSVGFDQNLDGFGLHDVAVSDGGQQRKDPLTFSIDVNGDSFGDYFDSSQPGGQGPSWFSAHVADIRTYTGTDNGDSSGIPCTLPGDGCIELSSAWFGSQGGGGRPPAAIPVPAAVWLFGSGILALTGVARTRKTT